MSDLAAGQNLGTADPGSRSPWHVDVRALHRVAQELALEGGFLQRQRVNCWCATTSPRASKNAKQPLSTHLLGGAAPQDDNANQT